MAGASKKQSHKYAVVCQSFSIISRDCIGVFMPRKPSQIKDENRSKIWTIIIEAFLLCLFDSMSDSPLALAVLQEIDNS